MPKIVYEIEDVLAVLKSQDSVLAAIQAVQASHFNTLSAIQQQQQQQGVQMATNAEVIKGKIDELKADVAATKGVNESIIALLKGITAQNSALVQQLKDAIAAGLSPAELTEIVDEFAAVNTEMDAQRQELADAGTANTPPSA